MRGKFITFEGIEGVGKTTQVNLLKKYLQKKGRKVIVTREPGGTKIGEKIREILADGKNEKMEPLTEFLLFSASRSQHIKEIIKGALDAGHIVISDRFYDASFAYQGYGRGLDLNLIKKINKKATFETSPDLTIYLDLDPQTGFKRVLKRGNDLDRIEKEKNAFFNKVRNGYIAINKREPKRFKTIDASRSIEEVHKEIVELVTKIL